MGMFDRAPLPANRRREAHINFVTWTTLGIVSAALVWGIVRFWPWK